MSHSSTLHTTKMKQGNLQKNVVQYLSINLLMALKIIGVKRGSE